MSATRPPVRQPGIRKYRDPNFDAIAVRLMPGYHYVTSNPREMIVTVLGSCVAACVRDPILGVGGMNHFMLPQSDCGDWGGASSSLRYGNFAMERLINDILHLGGRKNRLEIKVFGGATAAQDRSDIGSQNAAFVTAYLESEQLPVIAKRLNEAHPLRVHYFPVTGRALGLDLASTVTDQELAAERRYRTSLGRTPVGGTVELFEPHNKRSYR